MARRKLDLRNVEQRVRERKDGTRLETFRVRWVDEHGDRQHETFDTVEEAIAYRDELEARARRLRGGPAERGRFSVSDGYARWWEEHAVPSLQQRTRDNYERHWKAHLAPRAGHLLVADVTPAVVEQLKDEMLADGCGPATVRYTLTLLRSILGHAVRRGLVEHNAVVGVRNPKPQRRRKRRMPGSIEVVERMRRVAVEELDSPFTAIAISIGAYAGLRPGEARALVWRDIGERTISVTDAIDTDGSLRQNTKTFRDRAAGLMPVLAEDLWAWQAITPYPGDDDPVLPAAGGRHLTDADYKNFGRRKFRPCSERAGWPCAPYDLRHFNASLLLKEGQLSLQEIAGHLGHTLIELSRTYAREITEYRGRHIDIEAEVRGVRADAGPEDVLRRLALELGADPAPEPPGRTPSQSPELSSASPESLRMLVTLNAQGVLSDGELAAKLRQIAA